MKTESLKTEEDEDTTSQYQNLFANKIPRFANEEEKENNFLKIQFDNQIPPSNNISNNTSFCNNTIDCNSGNVTLRDCSSGINT
jgi:hypothetical protein